MHTLALICVCGDVPQDNTWPMIAYMGIGTLVVVILAIVIMWILDRITDRNR